MAAAGGDPLSDFLVISGLSGAGRSTAADTLEDLGWFVIDNLPPSLIGKVAELVGLPGSETERVALVVGKQRLGLKLDLQGGDMRLRRAIFKEEAAVLPDCVQRRELAAGRISLVHMDIVNSKSGAV